jgi:hypothetical protein
MNKFLKSASDRFEKIKEKDYLINPMSEVDCEIIVELGQILNKAGLKDVCDILKSYKENKDEDTRDDLLQWNIDNPTIKTGIGSLVDSVAKEMAEETKKKCPFLKIGEIRMKVYDLLGFKLFEELKEDNYIYGIIINPVPEHTKQIPIYANEKIEWYSEEDRNRVLTKLESYCLDNGVDFIDLME